MRLLALLALPLALSGQTLAVDWLGGPPRTGGIGWVAVTPSFPADTVTGRFDGAPLVFERAGQRWLALAPVRVESADSAPVTVTAAWGDRREEAEVRLPLRGRTFPSERLSVDPAFTTPPTGALARRIAEEREASAALTPMALATPRLFDGPFVPPRASRITSLYGTGRTFNGEVRGRHYGVDYNGIVGDSVVAAGRGVVALVGDFYYSGRIVYINHGVGLITAYLHLSDVTVAEGDTVARGQLIGRVGSSGRVTGPHLHWAVRHGARLVDGLDLLGLEVR